MNQLKTVLLSLQKDTMGLDTKWQHMTSFQSNGTSKGKARSEALEKQT